MLVIAPTIGSKPSTGVTFGVAANVAMFLGDPATTRISSGMLALSFSTKKQTSLTARFGAFTRDDRVRVDGDNRFQWTSQDTYDLGTASEASEGVNAKFTYVRVYETGLYTLRSGLYAGLGVHLSAHTDIRPGEDADTAWDTSPYMEYTQRYGFDPYSQTSAGASLNLLVDTRDNHINASRGWLASVSYRPFFKDLLGGDSAWQEVLFDVRTFVPVKKDARQKVAFWLYGDFVANGVAPYFDLPTLGMDTYGRSGRGYTEGRFRGERLVYGEVEYRATLTRNGLLGHGRVREHDHAQQPRRHAEAVRLVRVRRRHRPAGAVQQAVAHEPVRGRRLGRTGIERVVPGPPGGVLSRPRPSHL